MAENPRPATTATIAIVNKIFLSTDHPSLAFSFVMSDRAGSSCFGGVTIGITIGASGFIGAGGSTGTAVQSCATAYTGFRGSA